MSHGKLRIEKHCLNCNTETVGRFCHACGQENIEPKESVGSFFKHFFEDLTHFEGSFFRTMKALLFKPGFLSTAYMVGKRQLYIHPIRFYIFSSFVFFFLVFLIPSTNNTKNNNINIQVSYDKTDTVTIVNKKNSLDSTLMAKKVLASSMPAFIAKKYYYIERLSTKEKQHYFNNVIKIATKKIPQLLWVVLPLIIWLLKIINVRHKNYWYVNHGVFAIHVTIFIFTIILLQMLLQYIDGKLGWGFANAFSNITSLLMLVYIALAYKQFYKQSWLKTIIKVGFILLGAITLMGLALLVLFLLTIFI